jgi:hypothetical protein
MHAAQKPCDKQDLTFSEMWLSLLLINSAINSHHGQWKMQSQNEGIWKSCLFCKLKSTFCNSVTSVTIMLPFKYMWFIMESSLLAPGFMNLKVYWNTLLIPLITNHITKWKKLEEVAEKSHYNMNPQWSIFPVGLWYCFTVERTAWGKQSFSLLQKTLL